MGRVYAIKLESGEMSEAVQRFVFSKGIGWIGGTVYETKDFGNCWLIVRHNNLKYFSPDSSVAEMKRKGYYPTDFYTLMKVLT